MKKILIVLACASFVYSFSNKEPSRVIKTSDQVANAELEIYTASYCGECKKAKAYLDNHHITYVEYDVEFDLDNRRDFYDRGGKGIPFIIINGQKMVGFNATRLESLRSL